MLKRIRFYLSTLLVTLISARIIILNMDGFEGRLGYYSLADFLVFFSDIWLIAFFTLPLVLVFVQVGLKKYENLSLVLAYQARERIYHRLVLDQLVLVAQYVGLVVLVLLGFFKLAYPQVPLINWAQPGSFFSDLFKGISTLSFFWIGLVFALGLFFSALVSSLLMMVVEEFFSSQAFAWLLLLVLFVNEIFFPQVSFLIGPFMLKYEMVMDPGLIGQGLIRALIEIPLLYFLGRQLYLKKEFL